MESVRTAQTSYEASKPKSKDEPDEPDDAVNVHLYRSMIGSLMYLIASRPDIMFAVSACSRHQVTPFDFQFECSQEIFKVSYKALKLGLCVKSKPLWLLLQLKQNILQLLTVVVRIQSGWLSVSSGGARVPTGSFTGSYWFTTSYVSEVMFWCFMLSFPYDDAKTFTSYHQISDSRSRREDLLGNIVIDSYTSRYVSSYWDSVKVPASSMIVLLVRLEDLSRAGPTCLL
ncbi:hypothetical protein Tco_1174312 [Tanacetum coccineum]